MLAPTLLYGLTPQNFQPKMCRILQTTKQYAGNDLWLILVHVVRRAWTDSQLDVGVLLRQDGGVGGGIDAAQLGISPKNDDFRAAARLLRRQQSVV